MLSKLLDGDRKMESIFGFVLIHGLLRGEKMDTLELLLDNVKLINKLLLQSLFYDFI
jgi:hypothetical protein